MIVIAKFKGKNGSKGYVTGKVHMLVMNDSHPGLVIQDKERMTTRGAGGNIDSGGSLCQYSTLRKFLDNWEVIK